MMVWSLVLLLSLFSELFIARADSFIEPSITAPGGLAPSNTPQIVLLTFDDSISTNMFALVQRVLTNHVNPNGHPIKATFFASFDSRFDGAAIQHLYADGHEIAVHTLSHKTSTNTTLNRWHQEIAGARRVLCELAQIPMENIVGFRAPYLQINDPALSALASRGFLYDSSFPEDLSMLSTSPAAMIWPYTLHNGLAQNATPDRLPSTNYPSLFEIPLWVQFTNNATCAVMDPPSTFNAGQVESLWKSNFIQHYEGNRAPFFLALHATATDQWLSDPAHSAWRIDVLNNFITWTLTHTNTWFLSCRDLIAYMRTPVPAYEASTNACFLTTTNAYFANPTPCAYQNSHTFTVCGPCLPAAPTYSNAFLGYVPINCGTVGFTIASQDSSYAYCSMVISNNSTNAFYDWQVAFDLSNGAISKLYDATWSQTGSVVHAKAQQYNKYIAPGANVTVGFRVSPPGGFEFATGRIYPSKLGQTDITLQHSPPPLSVLHWTDDAHEYSLEWSTNLTLNQWTEATNKLFQSSFTNISPSTGAPLFLRVKGKIY